MSSWALVILELLVKPPFLRNRESIAEERSRSGSGRPMGYTRSLCGGRTASVSSARGWSKLECSLAASGLWTRRYSTVFSMSWWR